MGQRGATGNLCGVGISGHAKEPHHPITGLVQVSNWAGEQQGISVVWAFPDMRSNLIICSQNPKKCTLEWSSGEQQVFFAL